MHTGIRLVPTEVLGFTCGARLRMVGCSATSEVKMPGVNEVSAAAKAPAVNPSANPAAIITLHVCPNSQSPAGLQIKRQALQREGDLP